MVLRVTYWKPCSSRQGLQQLLEPLERRMPGVDHDVAVQQIHGSRPGRGRSPRSSRCQATGSSMPANPSRAAMRARASQPAEVEVNGSSSVTSTCAVTRTFLPSNSRGMARGEGQYAIQRGFKDCGDLAHQDNINNCLPTTCQAASRSGVRAFLAMEDLPWIYRTTKSHSLPPARREGPRRGGACRWSGFR